MAQAFRILIRPLLNKNDAELSGWRDTLQEALGSNEQLVSDLVPELALILSEQPSVPELPPQDTPRRFQQALRRLIGVFARREHPLAIFLDDLQWLDAATLDLLEVLLTEPDVKYLLLIGAYRDKLVDSTHPLMPKLEAIRRAVHSWRRSPWAAHLYRPGRLIADSLRCEPVPALALAQLCMTRLVVIRFLRANFFTHSLKRVC